MKSAARLQTLLVAVCLTSCSTIRFDPPQRLGPPLLVTSGETAQLWLLVKQREQKLRRVGGGRRNLGEQITETFHHFDLQAHDVRSTDRVWKKRLLTLKDNEGGHGAEARILGQDGEVVWLFLHGQPVALSSRDGSRIADGQQVEQRNAALQGLMPKELKFHAFDGALIITTADARRYKVRASDLTAEAYRPPNEEYFSRLQFMATQWNGGYRTPDFVERMTTFGGRWLGLYTEKEAAEAGNDGFGDHLKNPSRVFHEGSRARRTFWTARIGKTKEFTEGAHDRLFDLTPVPNAGDYLEAGLLVRQGTKEPLQFDDPAGLLVLHRTRIDAEGTLALTRLDQSLGKAWTTPLPLLELQNRWQFERHLLLYGSRQVQEKSSQRWEEFVVTVDVTDGALRGWNVTAERALQ
ncbi:hypothetical protein BH20VER1_BH20VER1_13920 [soil metagenome]